MKTITFFIGVTTGIYIAQNYNIPKIEELAHKVKKELKRYETKP